MSPNDRLGWPKSSESTRCFPFGNKALSIDWRLGGAFRDLPILGILIPNLGIG
jgi:hypothetical protein